MSNIEVVQYISGDFAGKANPKIVNKTWGYELHYRNDDKYCMKWLHFEGPETIVSETDPKYSTSMHFHVLKHETLLVVNGTLTLDLIVNKVHQRHILNQGDAWVVCPGHVHRLSALHGPLDLIEASTKDYEDDSVRVG